MPKVVLDNGEVRVTVWSGHTYPVEIAVSCDSVSLTYEELADIGEAVAQHLESAAERDNNGESNSAPRFGRPVRQAEDKYGQLWQLPV